MPSSPPRAVGQEHGFVFAFEPAAARQVPAHAMRDGVGQFRQLRRCGRTGAVQARLALRTLGGVLVHAVEPQHVEVDVEIQRAAEALDQGHRTALGAGAVDAGLIGQPAGDHALHDAQHRQWLLACWRTGNARYGKLSTHCRTGRGPNTSSTVPRTLGHASRAATRAEPALLAGEGHQPLCTAVLAHRGW